MTVKQTINDAGNMTLPVEVYDIDVCLDALDDLSPEPGEVLYGVCVRLAALLGTPWPVYYPAGLPLPAAPEEPKP